MEGKKQILTVIGLIAFLVNAIVFKTITSGGIIAFIMLGLIQTAVLKKVKRQVITSSLTILTLLAFALKGFENIGVCYFYFFAITTVQEYYNHRTDENEKAV